MLLVIELEEGYLIYPVEGLLLFCGRSLRSSDFVFTCMYKRSHSHYLVDLLIIESEATCEEFPPNFCECSDTFPEDLPYMSSVHDLSLR